MVGRTLGVLWAADGRHHIGTVAQYHPELDQYTIVYRSGEVHQTDLKAVHWVYADTMTQSPLEPLAVRARSGDCLCICVCLGEGGGRTSG